MKLLELFSGTHSIGKVAKKRGYEVYSLDRDLGDKCPFGSDYKSDKHFKEDIMTWNYKQYPSGYFDIITASPVCLYWSCLRNTWVGRKLKGMDRPLTREDIQNDIDNYGKPMVDKVREIIDYFKPKYWWIENPKTGKMKSYITDLDYYDVDYCKYSEWGYQKRTRFWTNIKGFKPKTCKKDCKNIVTIKTQKGAIHTGYRKPIKGKTRTLHKNPIGDTKKACQKTSKKHKRDVSVNCGSGTNRLQRYRIPPKLINDLFDAL